MWFVNLRNVVKNRYRVYCLIGDGESAEGSIWEALHFSSHYRLDNLVAVFDINRLGQSEATSLQHDMDVYQRRLTAFGSVVFLLFYIFTVQRCASAIYAVIMCSSICPSVCMGLSQVRVLRRWLYLGSRKQCLTIAQGL